jgi:hypothetical protein
VITWHNIPEDSKLHTDDGGSTHFWNVGQLQRDSTWHYIPKDSKLRTDNGGSTHLWNVSQLQRDYMALHRRRLLKLNSASSATLLTKC